MTDPNLKDKDNDKLLDSVETSVISYETISCGDPVESSRWRPVQRLSDAPLCHPATILGQAFPVAMSRSLAAVGIQH